MTMKEGKEITIHESLDGLKMTMKLVDGFIREIQFTGNPQTDVETLSLYEKHCAGVSIREAADHAAIFSAPFSKRIFTK